MSDKYEQEARTLLKKKTSRRKKPIQRLEKDFDIKKFKDKLLNDLNNEQIPAM